jgi:hypothetical protein
MCGWQVAGTCKSQRDRTEKVDARLVRALHHVDQLILADLPVVLADRHPVAERERRHLEARAAEQAVRHRRRRRGRGGVCITARFFHKKRDQHMNKFKS